MIAGWMVNLSTSIWVKTVSRCIMARVLGMSKARMRSTLESLFQKMFWAMTSMAAAWVRWEMPEMPSVVREKLDSFNDNLEFVHKTMAGLTKADMEMPLVSSTTLVSLVNTE